jgi:ligand-binding sensor domain-containing protein/class 3 adenylate cyclase
MIEATKKKNTLFFFILNVCIISAFFLSTVNPIYSQTYYFDHYSVKEGLAQSKINCMLQDKNGKIWMGTGSGVSTFNGIEFVNYSSEDGFAPNGVKSLLMDKNGNIWFGHLNGGISFYDGKKIVKVTINNLNLESDITSIVEDAYGDIWMSSIRSGVIRITNRDDINNLEWKQYKGKEGLSDAVFSIAGTSSKDLYFITDVGIKYYVRDKDNFEFFHSKLKGLPRYFQITCMYEDVFANLWFGTHNGGLYKYDKDERLFTIYDAQRDGLSFNFISVINGDKEGNIWAGTWGGGITRFSTEGVLEVFNKDNGLLDNRIRCILEDREGNILIGTNESGLFVYKGKLFVSYSEKDGLINQQVGAVSMDARKRYWFGTNAGITVYDPQAKNDKFIHFHSENSGLMGNQIRSIKQDKNGNMWIGTYDYGVWYYTEKKGFVNAFLVNRLFPRSNYLVTAMELDKSNNLWVGTTEGLIYYEIDNEKYAHLRQGHGLAGNDISALFCDSKNRIWVGSKGKGMAFILESDFTIIDFGSPVSPTCIAEDKSGKIWVGTESRGVFIIENNKVVRQIKNSNGLLSDHITVLEVDAENNVYIGSSMGLNVIENNDTNIISYNEKDGFTGIEIKNNAVFIDPDNTLWFGTVKGVIKYDPTQKRKIYPEPLTRISRFRVNLKDREMVEGMKLSYNEKSITFDYEGISLMNPSAVVYQVMLEGAEETWRQADKQNMVVYSALPPGKYVFKVKAANSMNVWNENPVSFSFRIKPPYWQTWWFYTIIVFVGLGLIIAYVKYREKALVREKRILEEKVVERTVEIVKQKEVIEKEKEKSEQLLLNTLPVKVVDDLKKNGKTEPQAFENVTIFFSDVVGFTTISSSLEPKVIIDELNDIFTAFDDIMSNNQCERIKTIGDAYMAVCGMPEKNEKHAYNMVKAALEIRNYMQTRKSKSNTEWKIRIGIHSGQVVGGIVGIRKYIYDVFGDAINTASRMESNSEPMKINVSESTYIILKDSFNFVERGTFEVKGKGKMKMFFVES